MTDRLQTLLSEAAAGAYDYVDADRALRSARRRRIGTVLAGVAAVALATGTVAGVPGLIRRSDTPAPVIDSLRYPTTVAVPAAAGPLPAGPVGTAALIYAPCPLSCDPYLVRSDGKQYKLPRATRGEATAAYTLSPDGRWLGWPTATGFRLVDLASGAADDLADSGPGVSDAWAWSPDSRWVLIVRHVDGAVDHLQIVDVSTGEHRRSTSGGRTPVAVRSDGAVVSWAPDGRLLTTPPAFGAAAAPPAVKPDLRTQVRTGESVQPENLLLGLADTQGVLVIDRPVAGDPSGTGQAAALLVVNLGDGRVVRRVDLPASSTATGTDVWEPRAATLQGMLLVHWSSAGTQVVRLDTATGARTVLSTAPADSQIVLRGTRR